MGLSNRNNRVDFLSPPIAGVFRLREPITPAGVFQWPPDLFNLEHGKNPVFLHLLGMKYTIQIYRAKS